MIDSWHSLLPSPIQQAVELASEGFPPAMVVVAFVAVHDLVGPIEGADEVVAGALGAVEGINACDAAPDLMVRILVPGDVLVLPALTCRAPLQAPIAMISSRLAELNILHLDLEIGGQVSTFCNALASFPLISHTVLLLVVNNLPCKQSRHWESPC